MEEFPETQARHDPLVGDAPDILYLTDGSGCALTWNAAAVQRLGYGAEQLNGRALLELVRPDYREAVRRFYGRQWKRRIEVTYREIPVVSAAGETVWIGQNARLVLENGQPSGFHAVARDVTRQRQRRALDRIQARVLAAIAGGAPAERSLGLLCAGAEEVLEGVRCAATIRRGDLSFTITAPGAPVELAARDGMSITGGDLAEPLRRLGFTSSRSIPVSGCHGRVPGNWTMYYAGGRNGSVFDDEVSAVCADLLRVACQREGTAEACRQGFEREIDRLNRELAAANEQIQREADEHARTRQELFEAKKLEAVGRLASGLAHEFNNWLTVIMLYSGQIGGSDSSSAVESVKGIRHAAERAAQITAQLLAFGRKHVIKPRTIDFNALLSGMDGMLRSLMGASVQVKIDREPRLWPVHVDPAQMEQVIVNLALNARHALKRNGVFTLRTRNVTASPMAPQGTPSTGQWAMVEVSDTGCGMTKETLDRIFEPFFTTKRTGEGTGLGLATVLNVVRQSGGSISVTSEPGKGTTFRLFLPRTHHVSSPESNLTLRTLERGSGETVLIVDDDPIVRRLISGVLSKVGYRVVEAAGAREAISISASMPGPIDLLLTDLSMPEMSGRELAAIIRNQRQLKVLFMSAISEEESPEMEILQASGAYLPKPFSAAMLATKVWQCLTLASH